MEAANDELSSRSVPLDAQAGEPKRSAVIAARARHAAEPRRRGRPHRRRAVPLDATVYGNWELSADRANAARRALEDSGLHPTRSTDVRGYADRRLAQRRPSLDPRTAASPSCSPSVRARLMPAANPAPGLPRGCAGRHSPSLRRQLADTNCSLAQCKPVDHRPLSRAARLRSARRARRPCAPTASPRARAGTHPPAPAHAAYGPRRVQLALRESVGGQGRCALEHAPSIGTPEQRVERGEHPSKKKSARRPGAARLCSASSSHMRAPAVAAS